MSEEEQLALLATDGDACQASHPDWGRGLCWWAFKKRSGRKPYKKPTMLKKDPRAAWLSGPFSKRVCCALSQNGAFCVYKVEEGGSAGAFRISALYRRWYRPMLLYARSLTGDLAAAEDLVQNAFAKALLSYRAGGSARAWLATVLRNEFLSQKRRKMYAVPLQEAEVAAVPGAIRWKDFWFRSSSARCMKWCRVTRGLSGDHCPECCAGPSDAEIAALRGISTGKCAPAASPGAGQAETDAEGGRAMSERESWEKSWRPRAGTAQRRGRSQWKPLQGETETELNKALPKRQRNAPELRSGF